VTAVQQYSISNVTAVQQYSISNVTVVQQYSISNVTAVQQYSNAVKLFEKVKIYCYYLMLCILCSISTNY